MSHFTEISYWQIAHQFESDQAESNASAGNLLMYDESIQILRKRLKKLNAWPAAGDTFLELLDQVRGYGVTLVPTDYDWLIHVADSACNGEDIGVRYPSIFQKLLTFPELRQQFLKTLQTRTIN